MTTEANLKLPKSTRNAVANLAVDRCHPGLQLDKFSPPGNQKAQKAALDHVLKCKGDEALLNDLRARRCEALTRASALSWSATTAGALTLHLSRASALENAGICLHPLYGFVYLPGSGLKGMARAYAETVWLQVEADRPQGEATIARVFGRAPKGNAPGSAGSVVFHDAWPETWPRLIVDIVNNHHKKYYRREEAPGDWENPEPSYFLAVPAAGVAFSFALSPRRAGEGADDADLALAKEWLCGALCHLGAGAKTAAGYGAFRLAEEPPPSPAQVVKDESKWAEWSGTLELVTPAFLAGANQQAEDCDLRPATLRGLLRWWWRTMHAGHVDVPTLRALEAAVWGSTAAGSPVALSVTSRVEKDSALWRGKNGGLAYASYGMEENERRYTPEGCSWDVRMLARAARFPAGTKADEKHILVSPPLILEQASAALWLLCHFGGVGSKARKGFGSIRDIEGFDVEECKSAAKVFRNICGVPASTPHGTETPFLESMLPCQDLPIGMTDPQKAVMFIGTKLQTFARQLKKPERLALGLPRRIAQGTTEEWLGKDHPKRAGRELKDMRDAAPVHFHLTTSTDGTLVVRIAAFPSRYLPDRDTSQTLLNGLFDWLCAGLEKRIDQPAMERPTASTAMHAVTLPKPGDEVEAVLLPDKTNGGGWKAKHEASGMIGDIQNTKEVPAEQRPTDKVRLIVAIAKIPGGAFRWPTSTDQA